MRVIKKLNIISVARILGVIHGGIYLVVGLLINIVVLLFGIPTFAEFDFLGFGSGILATFLMAILVGAISFVLGAVMAWLYNLAAALVGGLAWEESGKITTLENKRPDPQAEVNQLIDSSKIKESDDTFSSDNPNFLSS